MYLKLPSDPLLEYSLDLKSLFDEACRVGMQSPKERQFLLQPVCSTPYFYHLPNAHKALINPPGRLIIASTNSCTSGSLVYIDFFLQSKVCELPSYISYSSHVINILKQYIWEDTYMWASLDVTSLYTSIPHGVGLSAVQYFLTKYCDKNSKQSEFLLDCI